VTVPSAGPLLVILGVILVLIGLAVSWGVFGWFGRLPGDIRIERESLRVYIPLVSMLVISVVVSLILYLLGRFR
jgi:Protein of unknown function (DUF2905)